MRWNYYRFVSCDKGDIVHLFKGVDKWTVVGYGACDFDGHREVTIEHVYSKVTIRTSSENLRMGKAKKK